VIKVSQKEQCGCKTSACPSRSCNKWHAFTNSLSLEICEEVEQEIITNNSTSRIADKKTKFRSQPSRVKNKHLKGLAKIYRKKIT
jgi:hypothetical protein